jgi:hypothetical protein
MDNNAQALPVQQGQNITQPDPAQTIPAPMPQAATSPAEKPEKQQYAVSSGHPEQGSLATLEADEDDEDDRVQAVKQEVAKKETPTPVVQMSHPEVMVSKELGKAGVVPGTDASKKELPEEPEQLGDALVNDQQQATTAQLGDATLTMSYGEAQLAVKKERSIKKGISWVIREIIRQWKKLQVQSEGKQ